MECLNNIVGITRTVCPCVTNGLTEQEKIDIAASNSGLYLDELEGAIAARDIKTLDSCGEYFRLAKDALKVAAKRFADDIELALSKQYDTAKPNYNGELGRITYAGFLAKNKTLPFPFLLVSFENILEGTIELPLITANKKLGKLEKRRMKEKEIRKKSPTNWEGPHPKIFQEQVDTIDALKRNKRTPSGGM